MAFQTADSALSYSPQLVSSKFVQQYYSVLYQQPELVQRFYMESGTISRPDTNGVLATAQGLEAINNMILSLEYLKGCVVDVVTEDSQPSQNDGIFILVTGYLTAQDMIRRKFSQSFFLAWECKGCYSVANDIFRFIVEIPKEPNQELPNGFINNVSNDLPLSILDSQEVDIAQDCQARDTAPPSPPSETIPPIPEVLENGENVHGTSEKAVPESAKSSGTVKTIHGTSEKAVLEFEKSSSTQPISGKKVHGTFEKAVPGSEKSNSSQPISSEKGDVVSASLKPRGTQPFSQVTNPIEKNEVPKKTYASVVKVNSSTPPVPICEPTTKATHVRAVPAKPVSGQPKSGSGSAPAKPVVTSTKPATAVKDNVGGYSVYVSNLPPDTTVEQVVMEFKKFGTIKPDGVQVRGHQIDGFCFAFVEFELVKSMEDAIQASPILVGDRQASVQQKRTRTRVQNGVAGNGGWRGNFLPGNGGFKNQNFSDKGNFGDGRRAFQNGDERPPQQRHFLNGDGRSPQHRPFHNGDGRIAQQRSIQNGEGRSHGDGILPHQRAFYNDDGRYPQHRTFYNGDRSYPQQRAFHNGDARTSQPRTMNQGHRPIEDKVKG